MRYRVFVLIMCMVESFQETIHQRVGLDKGEPIVTIGDGRIRGKHGTTADLKKSYIAFQGIPFAKPPIGKLRFSPPEKNVKWNGTLNATRDKPECVQGVLPVTGSEDCLYINVYTTSLASKKAVMVYIYGGAFAIGNSSYSSYSPDWLLEEDVVYVSFNYRLGVFGFFSTLDTVAPGNLGLKDQCLALKWIQHNIHHFGGDPNKITIFGQSAGSASVSYQLQSTCAKGTFQRAILQSGSSICLWALHRQANRTAHAIAKLFNADSSNTTKILEGLRRINYTVLQQGSLAEATKIALENPLAGIQFGPVIEPYHAGAFFYNYSEEGLSQGNFNHVPTMMGVNSNEGAAAGDIPALIRPYLLKYDLQYELLAPADLTSDLQIRREAAFAIKLHYFNILPMSLQTDSVIEYISDDQFNRPIRRTALNMGKYAPVYFYVFSYEGILGGITKRQLLGVGHSEELGYIFREGFTNVPDSDTLTRVRMVKLWTNFAKYGNPTPKPDSVLQNINWTLSSTVPNNLVYLNISEELEIGMNPFNENMRFYDKIYRKYGDPPYNTY